MQEIKCPKCGGELEVHEGQKKTFCKYCGSQILLDDGNRIINVCKYRGKSE